MLIESASLLPSGKKAWLVSEHLDSAPQGCLTFWLWMYGTGESSSSTKKKKKVLGRVQNGDFG